eukprot:TRINITY_DN13193_c0_g1_i1.p1 TRINITY_DN13193_c0_g1~~TRINITY_DN13193_c0_g1_i1.p1  ORF type:complete len:55 (-),score=4.61 TRINITY_DN13193_c0_g1_i1:450-614(-)
MSFILHIMYVYAAILMINLNQNTIQNHIYELFRATNLIGSKPQNLSVLETFDEF